MKKLITLLLLFTLVGFLSGNQIVITNDYEYIITTEATYNFSNGSESNNVKYDRTNKIQIQNNKVIANPLNYHYAFFWDETDTFIGYYKTNKGITTSGAYLGQINTQSIPLPLNAYSFALIRYNDDYVLSNGYTVSELFEDNNLLYIDPNFSQVNTTSTTYYVETDGTFTTLVDIFRYTSLTSEVFYYKLKVSGIEFNRIIVSNGIANVNISGTTFENSFLLTMVADSTVNFFGVRFGLIGTAFNIKPYAINLTALGLTSETLITMDGYYDEYEDWENYTHILPLAFNTQTISFETIYFDDGVSTEIEQLGSILIFTLIGFTLMIFGFASKRRIFNLLAVGAFVVLGFLLIEFVGFIIILFGLIFVNVYYTFFGEL
jgi:hypothetical protein